MSPFFVYVVIPTAAHCPQIAESIFYLMTVNSFFFSPEHVPIFPTRVLGHLTFACCSHAGPSFGIYVNPRKLEIGWDVEGMRVIESSRVIRMGILNSYTQWFVPLYKHTSILGIPIYMAISNVLLNMYALLSTS